MASFNKVIMIGNMTADPEIKQTVSGTPVCTFSIAVNRIYAKGAETEQTCDFFTVVAWKQKAEFVAKYFKKGNPILVCGQLQNRSWTDNQGQKRYATEIIADEIAFVSPAAQSQGEHPADVPPNPAKLGGNSYVPDAYTQPKFEEVPYDEQLPF